MNNVNVIGIDIPITDYGFLGLIVAVIGIIISVLIYIRTGKIHKKQIKNEEGLYVAKTTDNLKKIQNHFDNIFKIVEEYGNEAIEDKQLTTSELNLYYQKNHSEMTKLLENSLRSLDLWKSLEQPKKEKFDKVIENFEWLTNKFFPLTANDEMREKIWTAEYKTFLIKKYSIDDVLREELRKEA